MPSVTALSYLSVLLVEPSSTQASIVLKMLENQGVSKVQVLNSAERLLETLKAGNTQDTIVISSLYLPDLAGTDLVQKMREDESLETVPFILISSETRPQKLDQVRQSGACFILAKPFSEEELSRALFAAADYLHPETDEDDEELKQDFAMLRVLLVDDSRAARRHMSRMLGEIGIVNISEAENGKEAVVFLQEQMVDLVITDYNMPEMDGLALTEFIRQQSWQTSVPVLMVTSEENQDRLAAVECAGVSAICDKPFEITNVKKLITHALTQ